MRGLSFFIEEIDTSELFATEQPYAFSLLLKRLGLWDETWPFNSFQATGLLSPVLVQKVFNKREKILLVDGFKRIEWARATQISTVSCLVIPEDIPLADVCALVLGAQKLWINTPALKALFLRFLLNLEVPRETILNRFMPLLGLGPAESLFRKYLKIAAMPETVLLFCHEKRFSMKRCLNLVHHKKGLLETFFSRTRGLHLSASLAEELLDNINDILKREGMSPEQFFEAKDVRRVLDQNTDARVKASSFRQLIRRLKFPVLTEIEKDMNQIHKRFLAGGRFNVNWDRALENRQLHINTAIKDTDEFRSVLYELQKEETLKGIEALLSYL